MKALTIYQPWASMCIMGIKPWEFRGRAVPRSIVDSVIVIHASARPIKDGEIDQLIAALERGDASTGLVVDQALPFLRQLRRTTQFIPIGAGLGTARIGEAIPAHLIAELGDSARTGHHQMAWPLSELTRWEEPVAARGMQGFWTWDPGRDMVGF